MGVGLALDRRRDWEGMQGSLWLGHWELRGCVSVGVGWAAVRDRVSTVAPATGLGTCSRAQEPHSCSEEVAFGICPWLGFIQEGPPKSRSSGGSHPVSPRPSCVPVSPERLGPPGEEHAHWGQTPGFQSQSATYKLSGVGQGSGLLHYSLPVYKMWTIRILPSEGRGG